MRRNLKADIKEAISEAFNRSDRGPVLLVDDASLDAFRRGSEWEMAYISHGWSKKPLDLLQGMRESVDRMEKEAATPDTIWLAQPQASALYWYCKDLFLNPKKSAGLNMNVRKMYLDVWAIHGEPKVLREWIALMEEKVRRREARNNDRKRTE